MKELIERLQKAGYDIHIDVYSLLPEAVLAIETLQAKLEAANQLAQLNGEIAVSLKADLNEYAQAADKMAAEHKVEREQWEAKQAQEPVSVKLKGRGYPQEWLEFADKLQAQQATAPKQAEQE
jgi:hypothetical protein